MTVESQSPSAEGTMKLVGNSVLQDKSLKPQPGEDVFSSLRIEPGRLLALRQLSALLISKPSLIQTFWKEIGTPTAPGRPDITVFYCLIRRERQVFAMMEFVAGETLEELVKRSEPAACEWAIPLFCRLLDAFEGTPAGPPADGPSEGLLRLSAGFLEFVDFGIVRATSPIKAGSYGTVIMTPDGSMCAEIFGEGGEGRTQSYPLLAAIHERILGKPADPPHVPQVLDECAILSVSGTELRKTVGDPALQEERPPARMVVPRGRRGVAARILIFLAIAVVSASLVLGALFGVGRYLSRKRAVADSAKLVLLPPWTTPVDLAAEADSQPPVEIIAAPRIPDSKPKPARANPARSQPSVQLAAPLPRPSASKTRAVPPALKPSILLTRGARPVRQTILEYPLQAREEHISGIVKLQLIIGEDGSVQSPRILSGPPLLVAGLAEAVSKWVYEPLRINGKPVPMTTEMELKFNLNQ